MGLFATPEQGSPDRMQRIRKTRADWSDASGVSRRGSGTGNSVSSRKLREAEALRVQESAKAKEALDAEKMRSSALQEQLMRRQERMMVMQETMLLDMRQNEEEGRKKEKERRKKGAVP